MKLAITYASLVALLPTVGISQEFQKHPGTLLEIVSEHDRRIARLEADVISLCGTRAQSSNRHADQARVPAQTPSTEIYRVKPGESLGQIAKRNGISTAELARINGINNPNQIEVGQLIQFPNSIQNPRDSAPPSGSPHQHHNHDQFAGSPDSDRHANRPIATDIDPPPPPSATEHTVGKGDTLFKIASTYGISIASLRDANGLFTDNIHIGQRLRIPGSEKSVFISQPTSTPPRQQFITHQVKPSETSASIARKYGISVRDLTLANNLDDPGQIIVGQSLKIPSGSQDSPSLDLGLGQGALDGHTPAAPQRKDHYASYRVRKGDTVTAIAREFEVTPDAILTANNLDKNASIRVGQDIKIPVDQFWSTLSPPR